jgi:hypothetical protein
MGLKIGSTLRSFFHKVEAKANQWSSRSRRPSRRP